MKKISLLLVSTAIMMVSACKNQQSSGTAAATSDSTAVTPASVATAEGDVAWVNIDSLMAHYQMAIDLTAELTAKMDKMSAELNNKQKKFQANVADFQNKAQKGLETRAKLAEMQQQLAADEQSLMQLNENYRMQLAEEQTVMQRKVLQGIMDYLKEFNKDKRYKYIHANTFPGSLLYADPSLDITSAVLAGINTYYAQTKTTK